MKTYKFRQTISLKRKQNQVVGRTAGLALWKSQTNRNRSRCRVALLYRDGPPVLTVRRFLEVLLCLEALALKFLANKPQIEPSLSLLSSERSCAVKTLIRTRILVDRANQIQRIRCGDFNLRSRSKFRVQSPNSSP